MLALIRLQRRSLRLNLSMSMQQHSKILLKNVVIFRLNLTKLKLLAEKILKSIKQLTKQTKRMTQPPMKIKQSKRLLQLLLVLVWAQLRVWQ